MHRYATLATAASVLIAESARVADLGDVLNECWEDSEGDIVPRANWNTRQRSPWVQMWQSGRPQQDSGTDLDKALA